MSQFLRVTDLNVALSESSGFYRWRAAHVRRPVGVRAADGSPSVADVSPHRRALRRRSSCPRFQLHESIALHGFRTTHLSRELTRHRHLPSGTVREALPSGYSGSRGEKHACRRQRSARLAHLCGVRAAPDQDRARALRRRALRGRPQGNRLRARFHHHRPVPDAVPLGTIPLDQGSDQTAHVDRPARQHPELHPHLRWQAARCQRPRPVAARGGRFLRDGQGAISISSACTDCT